MMENLKNKAEVEPQSGLRTRFIRLDSRDEQAEEKWRKDSAVFWQSSKDDLRTTFDRYLRLTPIREGVEFEKVEGPRIQGWWTRPKGAPAGRSVLYLHGGGYGLGSAEAYRGFVSQIADHAKSSAFTLEYPLAPEVTLPVAYNLAILSSRMALKTGSPEACYCWRLRRRRLDTIIAGRAHDFGH